MNSIEFEREARRLSADIDAEATRLMRLGVLKWDAVIQARQRVEQRRRGHDQITSPDVPQE